MFGTTKSQTLVLLTVICATNIVYGNLAVPDYRDINWTHHVTLPSDFQLKWTNSDPEWLIMEMNAPTKGYIGIGFSRTGSMAGSDMALGWVDDNGKAHFKDYHGTQNGVPIEDPQQDYELIYASEVDESGTKIVFRRKWDTCDDEHDIPIGEDTIRLIWAWSRFDPKDNTILEWHGPGENRGARSIYMKTPPKPMKFPDSDPTSNIQYWDATMHNVQVPHLETYYRCKIFKFPKFDKKQHMVGYRPLISPEHAPYIHHINVLNCQVPESFGKTSDFMEKYVNSDSMNCFEAPKEWLDYCYAYRVAHGVGAEGEMLPSYLGDTISEPGEDSYFRLEVHYENPYGHRLVDSSGMRLFFTEDLRQYEISLLFAGHRRSPFLTIPPHQENFKISGHCSGECTQIGFPQTGIKIISVLLHAHLRARRLILRHIRHGIELEPIAYDNHYDFNYQEYRSLTHERTVLPGDELIMECDFETTKNHTYVYGGLSTKREMCEAFIFFYPKTTLVDCRSQPELSSYLSALNVTSQVNGELLRKLNLPYDPMRIPEKDRDKALADDSAVIDLYTTKPLTADVFNSVYFEGSNKYDRRNLQEYMNNLNWKDGLFASKVEALWRSQPRYMHCSKHGGIRLNNNHISQISTYEPYQMKPRECANLGKSSGTKFSTTTNFQFYTFGTLATIIMTFHRIN